MSDMKASPEMDSVTCEIEVAAPPERVFQALTDPKQLFAWWGKEPSVELLSFEMEGRSGGRWQFRCKPVPGAKHGEVGEQLLRSGVDVFEAYGEVLECVPPRLVVWSWSANWHQQPERKTTVRWELSRTPNGTKVQVTHSGLTDEPVARKDYSGGWPGVLRLLEQHFR